MLIAGYHVQWPRKKKKLITVSSKWVITVRSVKVTTSCSVKFLGLSLDTTLVYSFLQELSKDGNKKGLGPAISLVSILTNFYCYCCYDYHIVTVTSVVSINITNYSRRLP